MGPLVVVAVIVGRAAVLLASEGEMGGSRVEVTIGVFVVPSSSGPWKLSPRATEYNIFHQFTKVNGHVTICITSWCATILTLFGAHGVKVCTAASIVHTQGVALTFAWCEEGAAALHTGLCGIAGCLLECDTATTNLKAKMQSGSAVS